MLRKFLGIFLALAIAAGMHPVLHGERTAPGPGAGLDDLIRAVTVLSSSAENPEAFEDGFRQAVVTLQEAAGLAQSLASKAPEARAGHGGWDSVFLLALRDFSASPGVVFFVEDAPLSHECAAVRPPHRPPRTC